MDAILLTRTVVSNNPECVFKVGDRVSVTLHSGRLVDAIVKGVVPGKRGVKLQVDYGKDGTALVYLWQVHPAK